MDRRLDTSSPATDRSAGPTPVDPLPDCPCPICRAFVSTRAMDRLEVDIMDLVAELLDRGRSPEELVDEVDQLAHRGPFAGEIVTLAMVSHAGYWLDELVVADLVVQVDELTACFHHLVGQTVSGWLARWAHDIDIRLAYDAVVDVFEILPVLVLTAPNRVSRPGRVTELWRRHRC